MKIKTNSPENTAKQLQYQIEQLRKNLKSLKAYVALQPASGSFVGTRKKRISVSYSASDARQTFFRLRKLRMDPFYFDEKILKNGFAKGVALWLNSGRYLDLEKSTKVTEELMYRRILKNVDEQKRDHIRANSPRYSKYKQRAVGHQKSMVLSGTLLKTLKKP